MHHLGMKKLYVILLILIFPSTAIWSQVSFGSHLFNEDGELRTIYVQRHRINEDYILSGDVGSYLGLGNNVWTRWGIRASLQKKLNEFYSIDAGFMYNLTNFYEEEIEGIDRERITRHEYRPHQTFHISYPRFRSSVLKHRIRLEERFFNNIGTEIKDFKMRLRYRVYHQARFDGQPIGPKSLFYRGFAEFNFNLVNEAENAFWVRGRYCAGLGYQFNAKFTVDGNYFYEHTKIAKGMDEVITHIFQITLRHSLNWKLNQ